MTDEVNTLHRIISFRQIDEAQIKAGFSVRGKIYVGGVYLKNNKC